MTRFDHISRIARYSGRALLTAWAAFWLWFAIAVFSGEVWKGGWVAFSAGAAPVGAITGGVLLLAIAGWLAPAVGGPLAMAAAVFAWFYFDNSGARMLLALPIFVVGLLLLVGGFGKRLPRLPGGPNGSPSRV